MQKTKESSAPLLLFTLLGLLIFGYSMTFGFIFDDEAQIVLNPWIHSLSNLLKAFTGSTLYGGGTPSFEGIYYKPVLSVCYMILWSVSGGSAWVFHGFQLLLHICNSFLLFLFLRHLLSQDS